MSCSTAAPRTPSRCAGAAGPASADAIFGSTEPSAARKQRALRAAGDHPIPSHPFPSLPIPFYPIGAPCQGGSGAAGRALCSAPGPRCALRGRGRAGPCGSLTSEPQRCCPGARRCPRGVQAAPRSVAPLSSAPVGSPQSHSHPRCRRSLIQRSGLRSDSRRAGSLWVLALWTCGSCTDSQEFSPWLAAERRQGCTDVQ